PGPQVSPSLSSQPSAAPADGFASSDDEAAEEDPSPLHISWLSLSPLYSSKFLGLCSLPGCRFKDVRRNLQKDVVSHSFLQPDVSFSPSCYGGLGRSCLVAACLLLQLSDTLAPQQVIESLRNLRGSGAIQTIKQYNFLHDFRENLAAHLATTGTVPRSASR
ncbi:cyclin-dependent kinase inhibitor 3, partial [Manacus vitellinus]|uniref:cyclin-dependent kinase inhibitor 3 n=1 Tax=Manacus vitellinus TaxID=328815 RepID=UPI00115DDEB1